MRSAYFSDLDEIGEAYELESRKARITIRRPFQVGIAVYQMAKLRMLQFYYDFLDRYLDRRDFELIQMDTDSNYMAISGKTLGRNRETGDERRVRKRKKELASMGQVGLANQRQRARRYGGPGVEKRICGKWRELEGVAKVERKNSRIV